MEIASIREAESRLSRLVDLTLGGEEVIIAREGTPPVRTVPVGADGTTCQVGQRKGRVRIGDDFDALPADLAAAFGIEP